MAWPARSRSVSFFSRAAPADERAGAVAQLDHAFVLELAVGLGDRVGIDHELLRERPDAGQLIARPQRARFDGVLHLLHQLQVDGHARRGMWSDNHAALRVGPANCTTDIAQ